MLIGALGLSAFGETAYVTPKRGINMRSGPGTEYNIIAAIPYGTAVQVNSSAGSWYAISYGGKSGYASSSYLSFSSNGMITSGSASSPSIFSNSSSSGLSTYYSTSSSPSIFSSNTAQSSVAVAPAQSAPSIFVNGNYNTASSGSVSSGSSGTVVTVVTAPPQQSSSAPGIYTGSQQSAAVSVTGTAQAPSPSVVPVAKTLGYITGNNVRFREGPSTDTKILGEFQYGNTVYITGIVGEWNAVEVEGKAGYVHSRYVKEGTYSGAVSAVNADSAAAAAEDSSVSAEVTSAQPAEASAPPAVSAAPASISGSDIAAFAQSFIGAKYVWGGTDPEGFDCSGFVYYVYKNFGITLNRTAASIATNGFEVSSDDLRLGDILCFYSTKDYIGHVGIYIGNGQFIHASNHITGVIITNLSSYYKPYGYICRRIIS